MERRDRKHIEVNGLRLSGDLELPAKDVEKLIIGKPRPQYNTLYLPAEKVIIKDKQADITIDWQQLKSINRLTFVVGGEKLTFERVKSNEEEKKI